MNNKRNIIGITLGILVMISVMLVGSAGAAPFAYITNSGSDNVLVILGVISTPISLR